ncbi:MAG: phosphoadenosine phosphosulfate reductase family protein [Defluviitaleaceae bacterium]|nr:phosphoadenosine phosphosulfate reductase family protein [Defluviitaleaceae bacterium]
MYSYTYDQQTGGILLNSTPSGFSKEPRPVYAPELDLLGFDKYWQYDKQAESPYLWAEANYYYYRGRLVAKLKGGNVYTAPEILLGFVCENYVEPPKKSENAPKSAKNSTKANIKTVYEPYTADSFTDSNNNVFHIIPPEPLKTPLQAVDIPAMVAKNRELLDILEQTTVKKIVAIYEKHHEKLDSFHVAFSGGKDSLVLLDLVKKALPKNSFTVVFADTGMEFPDTYDVINKVEEMCKAEEIPFYTAKSHFTPQESWELFGPPSRTLRWCCYVHKSTPQILKLREVTGKNNYTGLDFVGVRAGESLSRAEYEYENLGKKIKGQHSHNSILEWTSAEVWLYIYKKDVLINETYKLGNSRAGCLFCPMAGDGSIYSRRANYTENVDKYIEIIQKMNSWDTTPENVETYITKGGWEHRVSGRGITGNSVKYTEVTKKGVVKITVKNPLSDWKEWAKTINENVIPFFVRNAQNGYIVEISEKDMREHPAEGKFLRQVFRKSAFCSGCRVCETDCRNNRIKFSKNKVSITDCEKCGKCHEIMGGCLMYESLKIPQDERKTKAINCFDDHAPLYAWLESFFNIGNDFFENNSLGPNQFKVFKRFLRDSELQDKSEILPFFELINSLEWATNTAQGLILVNLIANNPQMEWYVKNLDISESIARKLLEERLIHVDELKLKAARSVVKMYKRIVETPLGTALNFGYVTEDGDLVRTKCRITDPRVVLYALFKFSEKCNPDREKKQKAQKQPLTAPHRDDYKEFRLSTLLNDTIERDGISPTRIFGLDYAEMQTFLNALNAKYPEFITASFTHNLEAITLSADKSSADVLELFREEI